MRASSAAIDRVDALLGGIDAAFRALIAHDVPLLMLGTAIHPALDPGVRFLRRQTGLVAEPVDPLPGPLRILVAVGAPDEDASGNAVLDYERELATILDAIDRARQSGNAEVEILEVGHPDQAWRGARRGRTPARRYRRAAVPPPAPRT